MRPARFLLGSLAYAAVVVTATHWLLRRIHTDNTVPGWDRSPCADCFRDAWLFTT